MDRRPAEHDVAALDELVSHYARVASQESREETSKLLDAVRVQLYAQLNQAPSPEDKVAVVAVARRLVELLNGENASVLVPLLANVLRTTLTDNSFEVLDAASQLLGCLAHRRGFLVISETVSFELKRALEWMGDSYEFRRLASVLVLSQLAEAAPAALFKQMNRYFSAMWTTLCEAYRPVYMAAAATLKKMLAILLSRATPEASLQVISHLLEEALERLGKSSTTHGSLLAIGELFALPPVEADVDTFLRRKFPLVCDSVLKLRTSKDALVSKTVLKLIPALARFEPAHFGPTHLAKIVKYLLSLVRKTGLLTRAALIVIGRVSMAVGTSMIEPYLASFVQVIAPLLRADIKGGRSFLAFPNAILCVGQLAEAGGQTMAVLIERDRLLDRLFDCGLFPELVQAVTHIVRVCPQSIADCAEDYLLHMLCLVICDCPFRPVGVPQLLGGGSDALPSFAKRIRAQAVESGAGLKLVALATLSQFRFRAPLVHLADKVLRYLDSRLTELKLKAVSTSLCLLLTGAADESVAKLAANVSHRVVARVLLLATTDEDGKVRFKCMASLANGPFDRFIAHPENLKLLLLLCYDEQLAVRTDAIRVLGRLQHRTPGFVRPAMRKMMVQHMRSLELVTDPPAFDSAQPAIVMASFVRAAPADLVLPFVERLLVNIERQMSAADPRLATATLTVLGELAESLGLRVSEHFRRLLPVLVEMTLKQSLATSRREVVYRTLGKICQGGGFVAEPFVRYPAMLTSLLEVIRSDPDQRVRDEVLRLIGIVGALDPELYNEKRGEKAKHETRADFSEVAFTSNSFSPEFYSRVAITALTQILRDAQAAVLQKTVVQALLTIFRSLGARKTITHLESVVPLLLELLRSPDRQVQDFVLQELGAFVAQTGLFMGPYVDEIFEILLPMWQTQSFLLAVVLIRQVATAFGDEFHRYVDRLFSPLFGVLRNNAAPSAHRQAVLQLFMSFKFCLEPYAHFLGPCLAELVNVADMERAAISAIVQFSASLDLTPFIPSIVRALVVALRVEELQSPVVEALAVIGKESGPDFAPLVPLVEDALRGQGLNAPEYHMVVARAVSGGGAGSFAFGGSDALGLGGGVYGSGFDVSALGGSPLDSSYAATGLARRNDADQANTSGRSTDDGGGGGGGGRNDSSLNGTSLDTLGDDDTQSGSQLFAGDTTGPLSLNIRNLASVWSTGMVSTPQDWFEWLRRFVVTLLVESPSPAFRACLSVAQIHYPLARDLFKVAFASVWRELLQSAKKEMVVALELALNSPSIPPEILQTLLDLVEYMESEDALPIDKVSLGRLALSSAAYAKALRYAEDNYRLNPEENVEKMISLYTQLGLPDAALGVLGQARRQFQIELDESWMERLLRWDTALELYEDKLRVEPGSISAAMGKLRCLKALGEWNLLSLAADDLWEGCQPAMKPRVAAFAVGAAHNIRDWDLARKYLDAISLSNEDGNFYRAISCIAQGSYQEAQTFIIEARKQTDVEMTALVAESYMRAYSATVRLQQLVELEEIIQVRQAEALETPQVAQQLREAVNDRWSSRFKCMARQPDFMRRVLGVRALLFGPAEQASSWLLYATVCARNKRLRSSRRAITQLLGKEWDETGTDFRTLLTDEADSQKARPVVGALKYCWRTGLRREAISGLESVLRCMSSRRAGVDPGLSKMYLRLANWQRALSLGTMDEATLRKVADSSRMAIHFDSTFKSWHLWSLTNFETIQHYERYGSDKVRPYLQPAIQGFFQAIALAASPTLCFPDVLRVLTLWFRHAALPEVEESLREGFRKIPLDTWIMVIPQLLARIHSHQTVVRRLVHDLLVQLAELHPQALVYPLAVASKSQLPARRTGALGVMARMKIHSPVMVEQALMVGQELIGASVVLHEQWFEGLEDAAGFFYTNENIPAMLKRLAPLHSDFMQCTFETRHQVSFQQEFGADLQEAFALCENYRRSLDIIDLNDAWECYARVYYKLKKRIPKLRKLQMEHVSPLLFNAHDMELAVPGTYAPNAPVIRIKSFQNQLRVYNTKQRPRKLVILGSDGNAYVFVLKAHEDLRQDERVMQFFALANTLLSKHIETKALTIETYPIIPLSPNSGLIGFVPHSDTIHQLITDYRQSASIPLDIEFQLLYQHVEKSWNNYHILTTMQKVHVFRHICENTSGQELAKVMWVRAGSSERWLDNRTTFTNSFAVMSMVGYILGLGDRHPNNIVIDRVTGKLIHIDFGDCFETSIDRKKYPETVPFRCTRMLINCMEVAGVDGTFHVVCERVMDVLRANRDSLMAVLEAFVHDPLFNWKLAASQTPSLTGVRSRSSSAALSDPNANEDGGMANGVGGGASGDGIGIGGNERSGMPLYHGLSPGSPLSSEDYSSQEGHSPGDSSVLGSRHSRSLATNTGTPGDDGGLAGSLHPNNRAMQVIERIQNKLTGQDFGGEVLDHRTQVSRLIEEATSEVNLAMLFHGWCSFW